MNSAQELYDLYKTVPGYNLTYIGFLVQQHQKFKVSPTPSRVVFFPITQGRARNARIYLKDIISELNRLNFPIIRIKLEKFPELTEKPLLKPAWSAPPSPDTSRHYDKIIMDDLVGIN